MDNPGQPRPDARPDAQPDAQTMVISRHRQFLATLMGVYPVITILLYVVLPFTQGWPVWAITLLVAPIMVAVMVYWLIPTILSRFRKALLVPPRQ